MGGNISAASVCQALGALIMLVSILAFIFKPGTGQNSIKFLGIEGTLQTPSLAFLILGALLFIFPMTSYYRANVAPAADTKPADAKPAGNEIAAEPAKETTPAPARRQAAVASPAAAPAAPAGIVPRYDMSGEYGSGGNVVTLSQTGGKVSWVFDNERFQHRFAGSYVSPTEIVGIQTRKDLTDGCVVRMRMTVDASDPEQLCARARLEPAGVAQCDLPATYNEQNCSPKIR